MRGIIAHGSYLPYHLLDRMRIAEALDTGSSGGSRAVASYDEDTTSLAVEAGRNALSGLGGTAPDTLLFATASPAYLDKSNASAVHAALRLPRSTRTVDLGGALRSGSTGLLMALEGQGRTLSVASDIRTGRPGNAEESAGGDAAAAFVIDEAEPSDIVAELIGTASVTVELMDRWRLPGDTTATVWEERFAASVYPGLVEQALNEAVKDAGLTLEQVERLIVAGTHTRSVKQAQRMSPSADVLVDDLTRVIGCPGTAQPGLLLSATLDTADPDQVIVLVTLADGVDVLVLRTGPAVMNRPARTVAGWLESTDADRLTYTNFLRWRGFMDRQTPRRPDPVGPAAPPAARSNSWKFGLVGSKDQDTGAVNLPPQRISYDDNNGVVDNNTAIVMADTLGQVATFSIDRLAFSLAPPVVMAVVDFDGGGRLQCELTDVDPDSVEIGTRVEMSFRRMFTADGIHNYFWKGRPLRAVPQNLTNSKDCEHDGV